MRATFSPQFFQTVPLTLHPDAIEPSNKSKPIFYSRAQYHSIDAFYEHKDFQVFEEEYKLQIDSICNFFLIQAYAIKPHVAAQTIEGLRNNFSIFKDRLFNREANFYSSHTPQLYASGKELFSQFGSLVRDDHIPLNTRMDAVLNLSEATQVCSGGVLSGVQHAVGLLKSHRSGIASVARWAKLEIARDTVLRSVRKNLTYQPGNEIHLVNAILDRHSTEFGLNDSDDPFAAVTDRTLTNVSSEKIRAKISSQLNPVTIAMLMAEDYLAQINTVIFDAGANPASVIKDSDLTRVTDAITTQQEGVLEPKYGKVYLHDFLIEAEPDTYSYQTTKQPVLIARRLMENLKQEKLVLYDAPIALTGNDGRNSGDQCNGVIKHIDDLFWIDKNGDCEELGADGLHTISLLRLFERMKKSSKNQNHDNDEFFASFDNILTQQSQLEDNNIAYRFPLHWFNEAAKIADQMRSNKGIEHFSRLAILAIKHDRTDVLPAFFKAGINPNAVDEHGDTLLVNSVKHHCSQLIVPLVKMGAELELKNAQGFTALLIAAQLGKVSSMMRLLDSGAQIESRENDGHTALMLAAGGDSVEALTVLLKRGANQKCHLGDGLTALIIAIDNENTDVLNSLLPLSTEIDSPLLNGNTPLIYAVNNGLSNAIQALLKAGAKIDTPAENGMTALMFAAQHDDPGILKFLLENQADINAKTFDGVTALRQAIRLGRTEIVQVLLKNGADHKGEIANSKTPFLLALELGRADIVDALCEKGIEVDFRLTSGHTALTYCAQKGGLLAVKRLLELKADINAKCTGYFADMDSLMLAARHGHIEIATELIKRGADPLRNHADGKNALSLAIKWGNFEILERLPTLTGNFDAPNLKSGRTLLTYATKLGSIESVKALLAKGVDVTARQRDGCNAYQVAISSNRIDILGLLLRPDTDFEAHMEDGFSLLTYAASRNNVAAIETLVNRGAMIDGRAKQGSTAVMTSLFGNTGTEALQLLIARGADINLKTPYWGRTALMMAAELRNVDAARILIAKGIDVHAVDNNGDTAYSIARRSHCSRELIAMLKKPRELNQIQRFFARVFAKTNSLPAANSEPPH
jgi:ankyrin repeat protein